MSMRWIKNKEWKWFEKQSKKRKGKEIIPTNNKWQ